MVQRIYLQGSNGEADIENRLTDMGRREERVRCMKRVTWPTGICCMAKKTQTWALQQPRGEGDGREVQEGGEIPIAIANLC